MLDLRVADDPQRELLQVRELRDDGGHPRSEQMKVTERFRRKDYGHLEVEFTFEDAKAYTKPWSVTVPFVLLPDTDIIENICENEKDLQHIFTK